MPLLSRKTEEKCRAKVAAFCLYTGRDIVQAGMSRLMSRTEDCLEAFSLPFSKKNARAHTRQLTDIYLWGLLGGCAREPSRRKTWQILALFLALFCLYNKRENVQHTPSRNFSRFFTNPAPQLLFFQYFFQKNACARARQLTGHNIWTILGGCAPSSQPRKKQNNVV